ncbi:MAG: Holliday junction resolvase RuvX [Acidimicrobiia bacterium]
MRAAEPGRILGIDPGEVRVGVALSDPLGIIAQPLTVLERRGATFLGELGAILVENEVTRIVIGLPVSLSGREGRSAQRARALGETLAREMQVPVEFHDERFTTGLAESALLEGNVRRRPRRAVRDKVAAAVILQSYLDTSRRARP